MFQAEELGAVQVLLTADPIWTTSYSADRRQYLIGIKAYYYCKIINHLLSDQIIFYYYFTVETSFQ